MNREVFFTLEDENENSIGKCHPQQQHTATAQKSSTNLNCDEYVELPCDCSNKQGFDWNLIVTELHKEIHCIDDLIECMQSYNQSIRNKNFDNLYLLCSEGLNTEECAEFFDTLLPNIIRLALKLPDLIRQPIPILKQGKNFKLHFTQHQVSCLLANAFLCTFPSDPNSFRLPEINFNQLFTRSTQRNQVKVEKLKCFLNYFKRVTEEEKTGILTFERRCVDESRFPNWLESKKKLCKLEVLKDTTIEEQDGIQADFANKKIGGGVLRTGCVQEEIRFLNNPELVVARLFSESLLQNEVLILTGSEQFNQFSGYADSFKWTENHYDITEFDEFKRRKCVIVAFDAVNYSRNIPLQYEEKFLKRDCNKAFCAFVTDQHLNSSTEYSQNDHLKIISGNWGCGAYKGEKEFKSIIQLIAASESNRDMIYVSFEDEGFKNKLIEFYNYLVSNEYTVGQVYRLLLDYGQFKSSNQSKNFFNFVYESSGSK